MPNLIIWMAKQAAALSQHSTRERVERRGGAAQSRKALQATRATNSQPPWEYGQKVRRSDDRAVSPATEEIPAADPDHD